MIETKITTTPAHLALLKYLVKYTRLTRSTNMKRLVAELIIKHAKTVVMGMPEKAWREHTITLIKKAEMNE